MQNIFLGVFQSCNMIGVSSTIFFEETYCGQMGHYLPMPFNLECTKFKRLPVKDSKLLSGIK